MKKIKSNVACAGMDVHYKLSNVTFRDCDGKIVSRQWLGHPDRRQLAERVSRWPSGIPGIGLIPAQVLAAEIDAIERFRNHKSPAAYSLAAPRADDTGEDDPSQSPKGRHLGHRGNRTLKRAFIEAAHGAVRSGGRWRDIFDRTTNGGRRDRNRGYIKVARESVKVVYAVWAKGVDYQEVRPGHPGLKTSKKRSRSETGQLFHPMVHAVSA